MNKVESGCSVVGMACRAPSVRDLPSFWDTLSSGRVLPPSTRAGWSSPDEPVLVRALDDVGACDWRALRVSPKEASRLDPQQSLLLELTWEALEDAGIAVRSSSPRRAAVIVGAMWADYARALLEQSDELDAYALSGSGQAFLAHRLSHCFNLDGPSLVVDAGCSSALVALHLARSLLRAGDLEFAVIGGINLVLGRQTTQLLRQAGLLSLDGQCRPLDERADGFVRCEGGGVLVLKPTPSLGDQDRVYADVLGSAVRHNARSSFIMDAVPGRQAEVVRAALADAELPPEVVSYVELNGTGFQRGDSVEVAALADALGTGIARTSRVGSLKGNFGSLEGAGAALSTIKLALAISRGELPPSGNLHALSSQIPFDELGLAPLRRLTAWTTPHGQPRVGGVTALSYGGSVAHALLAQSRTEPLSHDPRRVAPQLLTISACTRPALRASIVRHRSWLTQPPASLSDICGTSTLRRFHHQERIAVVGSTAAELCSRLDAWLEEDGRPVAGGRSGAPRSYSAEVWAQLPAEWRQCLPNPAEVLGDQAWLDALAKLALRWGIEPAADPAARAPYVDAEDLVRDLLSFIAEAYVAGADVAWAEVPHARFRCVSLPPYSWERSTRCALPGGAGKSKPSTGSSTLTPSAGDWALLDQRRAERLVMAQVAELLELPTASTAISTPFLELGMTSASLTMLRANLERLAAVKLSIGEFMGCRNACDLSRLLVGAQSRTPATSAGIANARTELGAGR